MSSSFQLILGVADRKSGKDGSGNGGGLVESVFTPPFVRFWLTGFWGGTPLPILKKNPRNKEEMGRGGVTMQSTK